MTDDRYAQFLIMLEEACESARLAGVAVELRTRDGAVHRGVPAGFPPAVLKAHDRDGTGSVTLSGQTLTFADVVALSVAAPPPGA